jgi:hypothetical protein
MTSNIWRNSYRASIGSVATLPDFDKGRLPRRRIKTACWEVSQTLVKPANGQEGKIMASRTRPIMLRFFVDENERNAIAEKMKSLGTDNLSAYLRKIAIDGYIINIDHAPIKECTAAINKVGVNVNQIARKANAGGGVSEADICEVKKAQKEIWRIQRYILSKQL